MNHRNFELLCRQNLDEAEKYLDENFDLIEAEFGGLVTTYEETLFWYKKQRQISDEDEAQGTAFLERQFS